MTRLFTYGTLRDAEYQQALFDRELPLQPAVLADWRIVVAETGYLTLVPAPGERVNGALIELDAGDLERADGWEGAHYARVPVEAQTPDGALLACEVYVCPTAAREPAPPDALAQHSRSHVLAAIRAYRWAR